ncbi:MAG: tyrosine-type recombinase/integrase [Xanthobacteraceae bacterium]
MARTLRDASLDTRAARSRLKPRGKPYYRLVEAGLHLGYRKPKGGRDAAAGRWVGRFYVGKQAYEIETIAEADDFSDPDGEKILSYSQALNKARERRKARTAGTAGPTLTVRNAVEVYLSERDARETRRKARPARSDARRLERYVVGRKQQGKRKEIPPAPLADIQLDVLEDNDLQKWRAGLPKTMKATAKRRIANDLKAALNAAFEKNRKRLDPGLPNVIKLGLKAKESDDGGDFEPHARDNQILKDEQVTRLIRAAGEIDAEQGWNGDLYRMTVALAATGARFSQIARMRVGDCQMAKKRLLVPQSRKGKSKSAGSTAVQVDKDGLAALRGTVMGRPNNEVLLERWRHRQVIGNKWERSARGPWQSASEFTRPWNAIRRRAKMPHVIPYALRHSSIVRGIRANLPIRLVASMHDTSVRMIERHYAKWIVDGLEELAARAVVSLVPPEKPGRVVQMRGLAV